MAVLGEWRAAIERARAVHMNFYTAGVALLWTTAMRLGASRPARPGFIDTASRGAADPPVPEDASQSGETLNARANGCNRPPLLSRHLIKVQLR